MDTLIVMMDNLHLTRRNWDALLIIVGFLIMAFALGYIVNSANSFMESEWKKGWEHYCNEVMLGDNSSEGYVLEKVKHCK